jgi:outer membrane protein OmpA-like peptidoglycan-associated protein
MNSMRRMPFQDVADTPSLLTVGVTDLMTSLAVIFILLFTAYVTKQYETESHAHETVSPLHETTADIRGRLQDHFQRYHLSLDPDPGDPLVLRIVVPDELLNFEFGKGTLSPPAAQFLTESMPAYAALLCGPLREKIDSLVIEGHTDDRGSDIHNLKLSQERSFNVMVKALEVIAESSPWIYGCFHEKTSASGRGRQDLVYEDLGYPNRDKSRRVIFKIRLRSSDQLLSFNRSAGLVETSAARSAQF